MVLDPLGPRLKPTQRRPDVGRRTSATASSVQSGPGRGPQELMTDPDPITPKFRQSRSTLFEA